MGAKTYLGGARAVLADREVDAAVLIEDVHIAAIDPESAPGADEIDLRGRLLLPGLVDLHCDAVEKDIEPRPGVLFPIDLAVAQADKSGPSIRVGNPERGGGPTGAGIPGDHQRLGDGYSFSVHDAQEEGVGGAGWIFLHHRLPV